MCDDLDDFFLHSREIFSFLVFARPQLITTENRWKSDKAFSKYENTRGLGSPSGSWLRPQRLSGIIHDACIHDACIHDACMHCACTQWVLPMMLVCMLCRRVILIHIKHTHKMHISRMYLSTMHIYIILDPDACMYDAGIEVCMVHISMIL